MEPARVRIDSHRLMRSTPASGSVRLSAQQETTASIRRQKSVVLRERSKLHILTFIISFIFSIGVATLSILLFVQSSENLVRLIIAGFISATAFVFVFAWMRTTLIEHSPGRYTLPEEGDTEHHKSKSVAYAFVALAIAFLLAGLIMNTASAQSASLL